ncbi:hypothetical protein APHAL10511_003602 [Amanita phalloides]|nr:hypothetical protein APHAL10511_003602 [Amanita phalloides]
MTATSPRSTIAQPSRAQTSMMPVYLRDDETDSAARRTSLSSSPRPDSHHVENPKTPKNSSRDWYNGSTKIRLSYSPRSPCAPRFSEMDSSGATANDNWSWRIHSEKPDPNRILAALERLVRPRERVSRFLDIDKLMAIHEQDLISTSELREGKDKRQEDQSKALVFGVALNEASKYAFTSALFNGRELRLPLIVFFCVEELYRTGIYKEDLFRVLPNRQRLSELTHIFNSPNPHLNYRSKNPRSKVAEYNTTLLHLESTQDICALLTDYLCSLPEPILPPYLFDAVWEWARVDDDVDDDDRRVGGDAASFIRESQTYQDFVNLTKLSSEPSETTCINIVQHLLCLLPSPNFSLLVYLLAFFSHVIMTQDVNGMSIQDLGRLFGRCVFGIGRLSKSDMDKKRNGQVMMSWFLKRWSPISSGLFDVVRVQKGQQAEPVAGRVKPKSPVDLNSRPSPSAWLSKKRRRDDLDWSILLRSPKDFGAIVDTNATLPNVHFTDSSTFPSEATPQKETQSEVLNGPAISRRTTEDSNIPDDEQRLPVSEQSTPSVIAPKRRPHAPNRSSTLSVYSTDAIDERLLNVSFSPSFSDLYLFDGAQFGDPLPCPSGVPEEARLQCTPVQTLNTADELAQAYNRIRRLECQLEKNDTMVCEALHVLLHAKRRIDEIDGCLGKLEEMLRVRCGDPSMRDPEEAWSDGDQAFNIVAKLRKLMTREL